MTLERIKKLFIIVTLLFLIAGCSKESVSPVPFTFDCYVRFVDQDGNSLLQKNTKEAKEVTVKILEPLNSDTKASIVYMEGSDFLDIQVGEREGYIKKGGNRIQDYVIQVQSPEIFSKQENDTIRIRYRFKNSAPSVIEAFYNKEEPESITSNPIIFRIKR